MNTNTGTANKSLTETVFLVSKMDCPSEEQIIRLALGDVTGIQSLRFDIPARQLTVLHDDAEDAILDKLGPLNLGTSIFQSGRAAQTAVVIGTDDANEARVLKMLLAINAAMFVIELATGWLAESTGLIADSMDMFADAAVYGLALYAVGRAAHHKLHAAHLSGWFQMILAFGVLFEVGRRFLFGSAPYSTIMITVGLLALAANLTCLALISRHRNGGVHMKASLIFSANDVLANLGVIFAGALVIWSGSRYPDLIIGTIIALIVMNGARRILKLRV